MYSERYLANFPNAVSDVIGASLYLIKIAWWTRPIQYFCSTVPKTKSNAQGLLKRSEVRLF